MGNPAVPVILDAYKKCLRDFDVAQAYDLSRKRFAHLRMKRISLHAP